MRYRVTVVDNAGCYMTSEDEEEHIAAWLWRTLKHLRETWPSGAVFSTEIRWFEKAD